MLVLISNKYKLLMILIFKLKTLLIKEKLKKNLNFKIKNQN